MGHLASFHMAELLFAKCLLLGFFLTEVGFGASSLSVAARETMRFKTRFWRRAVTLLMDAMKSSLSVLALLCFCLVS